MGRHTRDHNKHGLNRLADWRVGAGIAILVPAIAITLYLVTGQPLSTEPSATSRSAVPPDSQHPHSIEDMVNQLAARLVQQPYDIQGWFTLTNSYVALGRYDEAVTSMERLYQLVGDQPDVLLRYADVLAMSNDGRLSGRPAELVHKALSQEPDNWMGLWLAGMAAAEKGDHRQAIDYWERLLPQLKDDPESLQEVEQLISRARQETMGKDTQVATLTATDMVDTADHAITVNVSLSPRVAKEAGPDDALFIYAKAVDGSPMPLAVVRKKVSDLPVEVILDDSLAMMPSMKLSLFDQVQVNARISKTGNAIAQSGDYIGESSTIEEDRADPVSIVIDKQLP
jgi:cytochrome c-type biogenesis protein CcmH